VNLKTLATLATLFLATSAQAESRQVFAEHQFSHATPCLITIVTDSTQEVSAQNTINTVFASLDQLDQELGDFPGNTFAQLNSLKKNQTLELNASVYQLLKQAAELAALTDGWFDITAPSPKSSFTQRDWRRLSFNDDAHSITVKSDKMKFDLTWYLRAHMVDMAIAQLQAAGFSSAQVRIKGISRHVGSDIYGPWNTTVGLTKTHENSFAHRAYEYQLKSAAAIAFLTPSNLGEQVDAKSKLAIKPQFESITVMANDAKHALAYAIRLASVDPETALRYLDRQNAAQGFVVDNSGGLWKSRKLPGVVREVKNSVEEAHETAKTTP